MGADKPHPLAYALPEEQGRHRSIARILLFFAVSVLAITASVKCLEVASISEATIQLQARCLRNSEEADGRGVAYVHVPVRPVDVFGIPIEWSKFHQEYAGTLLRSMGTPFLGLRTSPSGSDRLVAVDILGIPSSWPAKTTAIIFASRCIRPGSLFREPQELWSNSKTINVKYIGRMFDFPTITNGKSDQADKSHFTFDLIFDDLRVTIDGWLRDDDTVVLEPRTPSPVLSATTLPTNAAAPLQATAH